MSRQSPISLPAMTRSTWSPADDGGAVVGMQRHRHPVPGRDRPGLIQPVQQERPLGLGQLGRMLVAIPAVAQLRGEHQHVRAGRRERLGHGGDILQRRGTRLGPVENDGKEPRRQPKVVAPKRSRHLRGIAGKKAGRAQLDRLEAQLRDLPQHSVGAELASPSRHLADAPGDRRAGEPRPRCDHSTSSGRTGRWSWRERSQAMATRIASRASSGGQGLARRPAATSTNACSSSRYACSKRSRKNP